MAHDQPHPDSIQAVIFDCDGTLVDSEIISLKVLVDLVAERGLSIPYQEAVDQWSGCDLADVFKEVEARLGDKLPANFLEVFREHQFAELKTNVTPIAGAGELLRSMELPFCIASNAPQYKIRLCLETTGLLPFVKSDRIYSAYDVEAWKPRPELFLFAAEQMGVPPEQCAVVEDSRVGLEAGLAAGMVTYGFDPHGKLRILDGVHRIEALSDLNLVFAAAS